MKQRLLVDMDGVLADIYAQLIEFEYQDLGIRQSYEKMNGTSEVDTFKNALEYIFSDGFFNQVRINALTRQNINENWCRTKMNDRSSRCNK